MESIELLPDADSKRERRRDRLLCCYWRQSDPTSRPFLVECTWRRQGSIMSTTAKSSPSGRHCPRGWAPRRRPELPGSPRRRRCRRLSSGPPWLLLFRCRCPEFHCWRRCCRSGCLAASDLSGQTITKSITFCSITISRLLLWKWFFESIFININCKGFASRGKFGPHWLFHHYYWTKTILCEGGPSSGILRKSSLQGFRKGASALNGRRKTRSGNSRTRIIPLWFTIDTNTLMVESALGLRAAANEENACKVRPVKITNN